MRSLKILKVFGLTAVLASLADASAATPEPFNFKTSNMSVIVDKGVITEVRNLKNNFVWADKNKKDTAVPGGLGILKNIDIFRKFHARNGQFENNRALQPGFSLVNYFLPAEKSDYSVKKQQDGSVLLTYKGLSNGKEFLKDAVFAVELKAEKDGSLRIRTSGSYPSGNVYGTATAVANIDRKAQGILPLYGGRFIRDGRSGLLTALSKNEDMEAPLMIFTAKNNNALALWIQDPAVRDFIAYFNRTDKSHSLIFEHCNLMYFLNKKSAVSPDVYLNVFDGGWQTAATPYRNYFHKQYSKEIAARDAVKWIDKIGMSINTDIVSFGEKHFELLKEYFPAGTVAFMAWNARAPGWDKELPDWSPRKNYVNNVARAHKYGHKVMSYVNICCANYKSPAWQKYGLDKFFLPSRVSLGYYGNPTMTEAEKTDLMNFRSFDKYKKDRLYYGDLLSPGWRKFHVDLMKEWTSVTKTDALYEDTAGCGADTGNGTIEGLSGAQGEREQLRMLAKALPQTAYASEYLTHANAHSIHWPLKLLHCWLFTEDTQYAMLTDSLPLSTFIYGNRPWVGASRGYNDFIRHAQVAIADATGGYGMISTLYYFGKTKSVIDTDWSFWGHLHKRGVIFSQKNLRPYFPGGEYPENIICMYKGNDGIYSYYDDGKIQQMLGPDKKPLYGRIHGQNKVKTLMRPGKWPVWGDGELAGLNPKAHYAVYPGLNKKTSIMLTSLSDGAFVKEYFETPSVASCVLESQTKEIEFTVSADKKFAEIQVNGKTVKAGTVKATSPVVITAFANHIDYRNIQMTVAESTGISLFSAGTLQSKRKVVKNNTTYYNVTGDSKNLTLPIKVSDDKKVLLVSIEDISSIMTHPHDGVVYTLKINGKTIKSFDTAKGRTKEPSWTWNKEKRESLFDKTPQLWSIPLKDYAGKTILAVLEMNQRVNSKGDSALISMEVK
ncbi:MAG: hypothetical protein IKB71_01385 [Lentisphaeria bacterium]|nr:hypothetical protein [Lentisphaeria bacterium]